MSDISGRRSLRYLLFFSSLSLQFISGLSDDSSNSKDGKKAEAQSSTSSGSAGTRVIIICLVLSAFVLLSDFPFQIMAKDYVKSSMPPPAKAV